MKFTIQEKSWIWYDCANSAYSLIIVTAILPAYFKLSAQSAGLSQSLSTAYWGYASSFSTLIISLLAPLLGILADHLGNKKRYFKYSLMIGLIMTAGLSLVPFNEWKWLLIIYVVSHLGYQAANLFYDAFITDVTTDKHSDLVSSYGFGVGYLGSAFLFILVMVLVMTKGFGLIRTAFILVTLWWLSFSLPLLKNVQQKYGTTQPISIKDSLQRLWQTLKLISHYQAVTGFMIAYFFYIDGVDTIITMATSFGLDLGVKTSSLLIILLVLNIIAFPCTLIYGKLAVRFGTKKLILTAILVYAVICCYAIQMKTVADFWILGLLVGSSQGGIQALSRSYFSRLIPKNQANEFFGFYNVFGKFSAVLGPLIFSLATQLTGNSRLGIASLIILFILGGSALIKLTPKKRTANN
jgi:UMF1 family MFS transporter